MIYPVRNQSGDVARNLVIIVVLVLSISLYWQRSTDNSQQQLAEITETTYVSPGNEFEIDIPSDWGVGEETFEDDGIVSIELYGPRNDEINAAFRQREGVESESIEDALSSSRISELIDSSVGREYALLQITVTTETFYDLFESKQQYRQSLLDENNVASGIRYGEFTDFNLPTADGWKFDVTLFQQDDEIVARNYFLLGEIAEADILLYPADSNFQQKAEEIIKSMTFDVVTEEL